MLPTRVIAVDLPTVARPRPRLFETKGAVGTYTTFSHRWGEVQMLKTECSNLEAFQTNCTWT
jgi:fluoride ion exporter CrcB/FEX